MQTVIEMQVLQQFNTRKINDSVHEEQQAIKKDFYKVLCRVVDLSKQEISLGIPKMILHPLSFRIRASDIIGFYFIDNHH